MFALHEINTQRVLITRGRAYYEHNMCVQPLTEINLNANRPIEDDEVLFDFEMSDDDESSLLEFGPSVVAPTWIRDTTFDYQRFYFVTLHERFGSMMTNRVVNQRTGSSTSVFDMQTRLECVRFFDFFVNYFDSYNLYPDFSFIGHDYLYAVSVDWLGGFLCEQIHDENDYLTNEIIVFYHNMN